MSKKPIIAIVSLVLLCTSLTSHAAEDITDLWKGVIGEELFSQVGLHKMSGGMWTTTDITDPNVKDKIMEKVSSYVNYHDPKINTDFEMDSRNNDMAAFCPHIEDQFWSYDPDCGDLKGQFGFLYFSMRYLSILQNHLELKNKYNQHWDQECIVTDAKGLKEILELATGTKELKKTFYSSFLNKYTSGDQSASDDDISWTAKADSNWYQHICAVGSIGRDEQKAGKEFSDDKTCSTPGCIIKKRIKITEDIKLTNEQIKLVRQAYDKYFRKFDIEIVGADGKEINVSPSEINSELPYLFNDGFYLDLSVSNLTFNGFNSSIFGGTNITLTNNKFISTKGPILVPFQEWTVKDNTFEGQEPFIKIEEENTRDNKIQNNIFKGHGGFISLGALPTANTILGNIFPENTTNPYTFSQDSKITLEAIEFYDNFYSDQTTDENAGGCPQWQKTCYKLIFRKTISIPTDAVQLTGLENGKKKDAVLKYEPVTFPVAAVELYQGGHPVDPVGMICTDVLEQYQLQEKFGNYECNGYMKEFGSITRGNKIINNAVVVWLSYYDFKKYFIDPNSFFPYVLTTIFHSNEGFPTGSPIGSTSFVINEEPDQTYWANDTSPYLQTKKEEELLLKVAEDKNNAEGSETCAANELASMKEHSAKKYCLKEYCKENDASCLETCTTANACKYLELHYVCANPHYDTPFKETKAWKDSCENVSDDFSQWQSGKNPPPTGSDPTTGKCPEYHKQEAGKCVQDSCPADQKLVAGHCECKLKGADINNDCECPAGQTEIIDPIDWIPKCVDKKPVTPPTPIGPKKDQPIVKSLGEPCGDVSSCDSKKHLVCFYDKCACDTDNGWVALDGKCTNEDTIVQPDTTKDETESKPIPGSKTKATGSSCSVGGDVNDLPQALSSLLPYLILLAGIRIRKYL